jgi:hypothetical protein
MLEALKYVALARSVMNSRRFTAQYLPCCERKE